MNRGSSVVLAMSVCGLVGIATASYCEACPPVATAQATVQSTAVPFGQSAIVAAPFAQALVGGAYAFPASASQAVAVALPATISQPLVVAQPASLLPLGAVGNAGCAGGSCARATARVGVGGMRRMLLPRQRSVARAVVR